MGQAAMRELVNIFEAYYDLEPCPETAAHWANRLLKIPTQETFRNSHQSDTSLGRWEQESL